MMSAPLSACDSSSFQHSTLLYCLASSTVSAPLEPPKQRLCRAYHTLHNGINYAESTASFYTPTPTVPEDHLRTSLPNSLGTKPLNFQARILHVQCVLRNGYNKQESQLLMPLMLMVYTNLAATGELSLVFQHHYRSHH